MKIKPGIVDSLEKSFETAVSFLRQAFQSDSLEIVKLDQI